MNPPIDTQAAKTNTRRPVFFNLMEIQMPVGALTSILHRVTGVLLAIGVPFGVYLIDLSLQGPQSWRSVVDCSVSGT